MATAAQWNTHSMFNSNTTCPPSGQSRDDAWWATRGGPGYFESFVTSPTFEPLEVRLMAGRDSYYENLAIISMDLEACICRTRCERLELRDFIDRFVRTW